MKRTREGEKKNTSQHNNDENLRMLDEEELEDFKKM